MTGWTQSTNYDVTAGAFQTTYGGGTYDVIVTKLCPMDIALTSAPATNNQTVCVNSAITNISYCGSGALGATFSGLPAGVTGNYSGGNINISGTPTVSGTFIYTVTLTGACNVTKNGTITVNPSPTISISSTGSLNCTTNTVQVTTTVTPSSGISYTWSGPGIVSGNGTGTITVNQGGTYQVTVTNKANNCTATISQAVIQNTTAPNVTASVSGSLNCTTNTVQITTTVKPSSGISYNWSGPGIVSGNGTGTITVNQGGVYHVTVTNTANNCTATTSQAVTQNTTAPNVTASASGSLNCTTNTVQITTTVTPSSGISYTWSGPGIVSGNGTGTITVNQGGTYTVQVQNTSNGCTSTETVNVAVDTNSPSVSLSASSQSISCTNGTVDISVSPASSTYSYNWSGSGTFSGQGTATISTTNSGTYQVVVTNTINGCSTTQNINIGFNNNLVLSITGNTAVCQGSNINLNASGANTYTWTDGTNTYTTSFVNIPATSSVTFVVTGSSGSCSNTQTIMVNVTPSVNVNVSSIPNNSINIGEQVQLNASGASSYTWTPITGLSCANCANPIANPVVTTDYCVTGISANGVCSDSACIRIYVDDRCPELFVPNVFSPNGDTKNDKLCIKGTRCVKEFQIVIFNRWGEKVYESTDKDACWDGTYNGKDMSGATFVYYIKGLTLKNELIDKKGNITIVK